MKLITRYIPLVVAAVVFVPILLVSRSAGNEPLTNRDIVLAGPIVFQLGLVMLMARFAQYNKGAFTAEEKRAYRVLVVGASVMALPLAMIVVLSSKLPLALSLSGFAGLCFALYDLLLLIGQLRTAEQLRSLLFLQIIVPAFVAGLLAYVSIVYVSGERIINPIATFFLLRAFLSARIVSRQEART